MILTCHVCPRQLCFSGRDRRPMAAAFGWVEIKGSFFCTGCALLKSHVKDRAHFVVLAVTSTDFGGLPVSQARRA